MKTFVIQNNSNSFRPPPHVLHVFWHLWKKQRWEHPKKVHHDQISYFNVVYKQEKTFDNFESYGSNRIETKLLHSLLKSIQNLQAAIKFLVQTQINIKAESYKTYFKRFYVLLFGEMFVLIVYYIVNYF